MDQTPIRIPMEDDPVHSPDYPFCDDPTCPCHEDNTLIEEIAALVEVGALTDEQATDIVAGKYGEQEG